ncbi:type IV pilus modification protein PilV [Vogesella oryzae]|uniref:type IV pilus modification protein PilV n=1 Tax=Vogesella oryzae TaxID=1735285 RepID=UPI00158237AD|nr:type IV pilus modification protein PilV [Vogesella oryzae]
MNNARDSQSGFSLIEVLVSLLILLIGFMGIAALSMRANQVEFESYQRAQALVLVDDMAQRLRANEKAAYCYYSYSVTGTSGSLYLGAGADVSANTCVASGGVSVDATTMAEEDLRDWDSQLDGLAVQDAGNSVGAMLDARGCITQDGTRGVLIQLSWHSKTRSSSPPAALSCGKITGVDDQYRRVLARWVKIVDLTPTY